MLVNPRDLRILAVTCMDKPEGNEVVRQSLLKVLPKYRNLDGFVMDRVCDCAPSSQGDFKQVKYWAVDHFHALKHKQTCAYNPLCVKRRGRRFKKINLSAAEQVFSWFRNYARPLNESRPLRHAFKVLFFVKEHNKAIQQKRATYLNKHQARGKKASKKCACTMKIVKKPAMKMSKVMKAMKK